MTTVTLCALALALLPVRDTAHSADVCLEVARVAERAGIDPALAVAVAGVESRWSNATSHRGATGPMQVLRRYWGAPGQTDTERGVLALAVLTERYGVEAGLCRYAIGNRAGKSCRYARRVMGIWDAVR